MCEPASLGRKPGKTCAPGRALRAGVRAIEDPHAAISIRIRRARPDVVMLVAKLAARRDLQRLVAPEIVLVGEIEIGRVLLERQRARIETTRAGRCRA